VNGLTKDSTYLLTELLKTNKSVTELNLSNVPWHMATNPRARNCLADAGAADLALLLEQSTVLRALHLQ